MLPSFLLLLKEEKNVKFESVKIDRIELEEMGLTVSFPGDIIAGFVKDGYAPMAW